MNGPNLSIPPTRTRLAAQAELRQRLPAHRRRPLLVKLLEALTGEEGALGPAARKRTSRFFWRSVPAAVAVGFLPLLSLGSFSGLSLGWPQAVAVAILGITLAAVGVRRARRAAAGQPATPRDHLELGSLFVAAAYTVAQTAGAGGSTLDGPLYPVVYLVMAFLVAFLPRAIGLALVAFALAIELAVWRGAPSADGLTTFAAHAGFILLFAVLYHAVLAAQVAAGRRAERAAVERRLKEIEDRAREFRLVSGPAGTDDEGAEGERRWTAASVVEVEAAVRGILEVAEAGLRSHTCAVFLLTPDDKQLILRECKSRSDQVSRRPIPAGEGALGGAVKRKAPVRLHGELKSALYYDDGTRVKALLAVPLIDRRGGHVRGVILADRIADEPYTEEDERLAQALAAELLRTIAAERLISDMRRTRDEKERFYQVIEKLNRASKPREVFDAVLAASNAIAPWDFGAVTVVEIGKDGRSQHRIARVAGRGTEPLENLAFPENHGLVSSSVKLASSLPGRELKVADAMVFDEATRVKGLGSLKVFPLKAGEQVLGTLVLGSKRRGAFDPDTTRLMEIVGLQAAESILRARLFEQTEKMATTDGLTGLLNHRTFQVRMDEQLAAALRYGKKLSMILTDIDHFKSVNDTYGHPMGDQVLKGVAQILQREARATDFVARYGGEEFAIVMPETDAEGAQVIAERIRERVRARIFETEQGPLKVTLSLGVACCPDDARTKASLIELADECLYHAKRHGRDQTVVAPMLRKKAASGEGS